MTALEDLPLDEQVRILKIRLDRAERAQQDAETALEGRMRELATANTELSRRESELAEKLDIESRKLLAALSTAQMATIYGEQGKPFTASEGSRSLLGLPDGVDGSMEKLLAAIHPLDRDRMIKAGTDFFQRCSPGLSIGSNTGSSVMIPGPRIGSAGSSAAIGEPVNGPRECMEPFGTLLLAEPTKELSGRCN